MTQVTFAVALFGALHFASALPGLRQIVKGILGRAYGMVFGLALLAALAFAIWSLRVADRTFLYDVPMWGIYANFLLTAVAFVFVGMFLFRGSWRNSVRYPAAAATAFWGIGHLFANGDIESMILFGGLIAVAAVHVLLLRRNVPFEPIAPRDGHNMLSVLAGLAIYGLMTQLHRVLIGVPVVEVLLPPGGVAG
jgi:uncharacterized membrane protein